MKINKELVAKARAIIDGIPESKIRLHSYQASKGQSLSCGTICCGIGWLAHHPEFNKRGLVMQKSPHGNGYPAIVVGGEEIVGDPCGAIKFIFGGDYGQAYSDIFDVRFASDNDYFILEHLMSPSDKQLLLARMDIVCLGKKKWLEKVKKAA